MAVTDGAGTVIGGDVGATMAHGHKDGWCVRRLRGSPKRSTGLSDSPKVRVCGLRVGAFCKAAKAGRMVVAEGVGVITHHNGEHSTFQRAHNLLP